jgi:transcriptional regulator with XRE-family HTH domain
MPPIDDPDPDEYGPMVRRKLLGRQLRELRDRAKISQDAAAKYAGLKAPSISRMENGKQAILPRTVRLLCQCYGVGAPDMDMLIRQAEESNDRAWYSMYSDTVPQWIEGFFGLEAEATEVWTYQSELIPGLLQTSDYVRAITAAWRTESDADDSDLQRSVELRLARQRRLDGSHPPRLHAVINEGVVLRPVGGPATMAAQLRHLLAMGERDHITVQVLPFTAGAHVAMTGEFTMLRFPEELEMNAVFLEHDHGVTSAERPADIRRYSRMFERLTATALSPDQTRERLATLVTEYNRANEERGA